MPTLVVRLKNSSTQGTGELHFNVFDTTVGKSWLDLVSQHLNQKDECTFKYNKAIDDDTVAKEFDNFKKNILYINGIYDRQLTTLTTIQDLVSNQKILNDLHLEFEIYGDRTDKVDLSLDHAFQKLNEQIHHFETIVRFYNDRLEKFCACLVNWRPKESKILEPEDYLLFSPEMFWGYIYLGYSTTGKHWHSASYDNDDELLMRDEVRPQQQYSGEFYINFRLNKRHHYIYSIQFNKWWITKVKDKKDIRSMTLSDLAVGYIPLGELVRYNTSGRYIHVLQHDMTYQDKLNFNKEIWNNFDRIESISII